MTSEQQQWVNTLKASRSKQANLGAQVPRTRLRRGTFLLIQSHAFEVFVMGVIGLNVLGMALEYHRMEEDATVYAIYSAAMALFSYAYCPCLARRSRASRPP